MTKTAMVALGFAAAIVAAPAFAECPGHTGMTAQSSTPAPVAQSTPTEQDQVILTQTETTEEAEQTAQ